MMESTIKDFAKQFAWEPEVVRGKASGRSEALPRRFQKFVICGMGGSNLTADLLRIREPALDVVVHKNYGLPAIAEAELKSRLIITASYSGNTEETLSSFDGARRRGLKLAAVAVGGKLLARAKKYRVPYVQIPNTGIQPRMALGFTTKALLKLMENLKLRREATALARILKPVAYEPRGRKLARTLKGYVPVIYSSAQNQGLAYNWKIKFNETGKIPAFYNVLPELNHNEMTGLDVQPRSRTLSKNLYFIFLSDSADHPRIRKRMRVLARLYRVRQLPVAIVPPQGKSVLHKIFSSLVLADWTALYTAKQYDLEPEQVPMVEEFKRLMVDK